VLLVSLIEARHDIEEQNPNLVINAMADLIKGLLVAVGIWIGILVALMVVIVLVALVQVRRAKKLPPPPPCKCSACGSEQIDVFLSGFWDGVDLSGRRTGGGHQVGTCKSCGVHCKHYSIRNNDRNQTDYVSQILTEKEWHNETKFHKKLQRDREAWPFINEA
jgi:hypothetical protein